MQGFKPATSQSVTCAIIPLKRCFRGPELHWPGSGQQPVRRNNPGWHKCWSFSSSGSSTLRTCSVVDKHTCLRSGVGLLPTECCSVVLIWNSCQVFTISFPGNKCSHFGKKVSRSSQLDSDLWCLLFSGGAIGKPQAAVAIHRNNNCYVPKMGYGNNYNRCFWSSMVTEMAGNLTVSSVMRFWETSRAQPQLFQLNINEIAELLCNTFQLDWNKSSAQNKNRNPAWRIDE